MFFDQNTEYLKIWNFKRYLENVRRCIEDYFHDLKCGIHELRGAKMRSVRKWEFLEFSAGYCPD